MRIICSHGRGGSPDDAIMQQLAKTAGRFCDAVSSIHDTDIQQDPEARAARLIQNIQNLPAQEPVILAGFSMGGYTSVLAAEQCRQVRGLFLVAPALYLPHYAQHRYSNDLINVEIVHGWSDNVVIFEHSLRFARECNVPLHLLPGGHMMLSQLSRIDELFSQYLQRVIK